MISTERIDDVWLLVETKLKCAIPAYFKNVLAACGYDNKITIASIDENDLQYFEHEVRSGNVSRYFAGIDKLNILDGSTKTVENFQFTRGHKKFLLFIRDFLKHSSLTFKSSLSEEDALLISKIPSQENKINQNAGFTEDVNIQQGILMCKIVMSLINTTPEMYSMNMNMINKKISRGLLKVQMKSRDSPTETYKSSPKLNLASTLEGTVLCPFCSKTITVIQTNFLWDVSHFECHLEENHLHQKKLIANENIDLVEVASNLQKAKNSFGENYSSSNVKTLNSESSSQKKLMSDESLNGSFHLNFEGKEHQSFSEVLKESVRSLRFEKKVENGSSNLNYLSTNHLLDLQKESCPTLPSLGKFVIFSLNVRETSWPSNMKTRKYYVGKVCRVNGKKMGTETTIDVEILKKKPHSNYIFQYPETVEKSQITTNDILQILTDPLRNRRGGLVFKDDSFANYNF